MNARLNQSTGCSNTLFEVLKEGFIDAATGGGAAEVFVTFVGLNQGEKAALLGMVSPAEIASEGVEQEALGTEAEFLQALE